MIDLRKSLLINRLPHAPAKLGELFRSSQTQFLAVIVNQEKPIPAPGNIAFHGSALAQVHPDGLPGTPARDVQYGDFPVLMERGSYYPNWRLDTMITGANFSEVRQSN